MNLLITFHSVSSALLLEAAGKERGFFCRLMPAPRKLTSSCVYAAEVEAEDTGRLCKLLGDLNAEWEAVWREAGGGWEALCRNDGPHEIEN
jgi:hypothetical protein